MLEPVVAVVLRPAVLGVEAVLEEMDVPLRVPRRERHGGADEHGAPDPVRMIRGEDRAPNTPQEKPDDHGRLCPGRIHDGQRVLSELPSV